MDRGWLCGMHMSRGRTSAKPTSGSLTAPLMGGRHPTHAKNKQARRLPEHELLDTAPSAEVENPLGHGEQGGFCAPPNEKNPLLQGKQSIFCVVAP